MSACQIDAKRCSKRQIQTSTSWLNFSELVQTSTQQFCEFGKHADRLIAFPRTTFGHSRQILVCDLRLVQRGMSC